MRVVHRVPGECFCRDKLQALEVEMRNQGEPLGVGSIVRCDCGLEYRSVDIRHNAEGWEWVNPREGPATVNYDLFDQ